MTKSKKSKKKHRTAADIRTTNGPAAPRRPPKAAAPAPEPEMPKAPERVERKRYTTKLACGIDPVHIVARADELARTIGERAQWLERRAEENRKAREQRIAYDDRIAELALAVEKHEEQRDVEVVEYLVGTQVEVERQDTREIIERKPAEKEDLQEAMFAKRDPKADDAEQYLVLIRGGKVSDARILRMKLANVGVLEANDFIMKLVEDVKREAEKSGDSELLTAIFSDEIVAADKKKKPETAEADAGVDEEERDDEIEFDDEDAAAEA